MYTVQSISARAKSNCVARMTSAERRNETRDCTKARDSGRADYKGRVIRCKTNENGLNLKRDRGTSSQNRILNRVQLL
jgi:hypothetical protein